MLVSMRELTVKAFQVVALLLAANASLFGCSSEDGSLAGSPALGDGVAARVGDTDLSLRTIRLVAQAQGVSLTAARERAVRDALFSLAATEGSSLSVDTVAAIRARLARASLEGFAQRAAESAPTDEEVEAATVGHFLELNRPEGFRVVHAVVQVSPDADGLAKQRAKEVAHQIAKAVSGAAGAEEFEARARGVLAEGDEVRIESLDPVAADGRVLRPGGGELVKPFAEAAARLSSVGELSPVTETEFGYHVMMLLERTPPKSVPLQERRAILKAEILAKRARDAASKALEELRRERPVHIERSAGALMQGLQVLSP